MKTAVKYKKWIFSRFYIGLTQEPKKKTDGHVILSKLITIDRQLRVLAQPIYN